MLLYRKASSPQNPTYQLKAVEKPIGFENNNLFLSINGVNRKGFHQLLKSLTRLCRLEDFGLYFAQ